MSSPQSNQLLFYYEDSEPSPNAPLFEFVQNFQSEIHYYKSLLSKAQQLIQFYKEENKALKKSNQNLTEKCKFAEDQLKQLMKNLIDQQKNKQRQLEMAQNLEELKNKLTDYEKTIQILQGRLLILNVAIRKQEYATKCKQLTSQLSHLQNQMIKQRSRNAQKGKNKVQKKEAFKNYKNYLTPRVKKRQTVSTYETSATRFVDLRKNYNISNSRLQTEGAIDSETSSHKKFFLDHLQ